MTSKLSKSYLSAALNGLERYFVYLFINPFVWFDGILPIPIFRHIYDSTLRYGLYLVLSVPFVFGMLFGAGIVTNGQQPLSAVNGHLFAQVGVAYAYLGTYGSLVQREWVYMGIAIAGYYFLAGVIQYLPVDVSSYRTFRTPERPYKWEWLTLNVIKAVPIWVVALVALNATHLLGRVPGSLFVLTLALLFGATRAIGWFTRKTVAHHEKSGEENRAQYVMGFWASYHGYEAYAAIPLTIASGIPASILPISTGGLMFSFAVFWSIRILQTLRLTLYEDHDGWFQLEPRLGVWHGLARVPVVFGVVSAIGMGLGAFVSSPLTVVFMAPVVASGLYVLSRYARLGEGSHHCIPQSVVEPDERNMNEAPAVQIAFDAMFGDEAKEVMQPHNQRPRAISRLYDDMMEVNIVLHQHGLALIAPKAVLQILGIATGSTYKSRQAMLAWAGDELTGARDRIEDAYHGVTPESAIEAIEAAEETLEEARDLNEEVGREFGDGIQNILFERWTTYEFEKGTDEGSKPPSN